MKYQTKEKYFSAKRALVSFSYTFFVFALLFALVYLLMLIPYFKETHFDKYVYTFNYSEIEITLFPQNGVQLPSQQILNAKYYYTVISKAVTALVWAGIFGYAHSFFKEMNDEPHFGKHLFRKFRNLARYIFLAVILLTFAGNLADEYFFDAFNLYGLFENSVYVPEHDVYALTSTIKHTMSTNSVVICFVISCLFEFMSILLLHGEELQEQSDKLL